MRSLRSWSYIVLLVVSMVLSALPQRSAQAQSGEQCFPETGYCISGRIGEFWNNQGGLAVFGYPITPQRTEIIEGGPYQVQWFERNRLELHPENPRPYDVLLGRLGADEAELAKSEGVDLSMKEDPINGCVYFDTGWNVCDEFLQRYKSYGLELDGVPGYSIQENIALFGKPLSDLLTYTTDGVSYDVQIFERARFELHPENNPPYHVLLGLLGKEGLEREQGNGGGTPPVQQQEDPCTDVPDPVNANIRPAKCVYEGEEIVIDIYGFKPDEQVGFWITDPDGDIVGTQDTVSIGDTGAIYDMPFDTSGMAAGLWSIIFEGTSSGNRSMVYFRVIGTGSETTNTSPPPTSSGTCADTPDPVNANIRPSKCVSQGTQIVIDIYGFKPNEQVGFWITAPDDSVMGTRETLDIGDTGAVYDLPLDTSDMTEGIWTIVFEGTSSGNKSIVYFFVDE